MSYKMTQSEEEEAKELLEITSVKQCYREMSATNVNPRLNTFSCREKERLKTVSSFTVRSGDEADYPQFGQILHFVNVFDGETTHSLAKVEWMPRPDLDRESLLWHTKISEQPAGTSLVCVSSLPPPLVTAIEGDRMWFLDMSLKYCN